jgi:hypothetical protein
MGRNTVPQVLALRFLSVHAARPGPTLWLPDVDRKTVCVNRKGAGQSEGPGLESGLALPAG